MCNHGGKTCAFYNNKKCIIRDINSLTLSVINKEAEFIICRLLLLFTCSEQKILRVFVLYSYIAYFFKTVSI